MSLKYLCGCGALALCLALTACDSPELIGVPGDSFRLPDDQVDVLLQNDMSGLDGSRQRIVIRTADEWAAFWAGVHSTVTPVPPVPVVNFEQSTVIALVMGTRSSAGYSIHVDEVYERDGRLYVVVEETSPAGSCFLPQVLTNPVTAIRVARFDGDVTFIERRTERRCT